MNPARRPILRDGSAFASASDFLPRSDPAATVRAGGDVECAHCGRPYRDHPLDPYEVTTDGRRWLTVLCDQRRVRL